MDLELRLEDRIFYNTIYYAFLVARQILYKGNYNTINHPAKTLSFVQEGVAS